MSSMQPTTAGEPPAEPVAEPRDGSAARAWSWAEPRPKPRAKEQEVLDVATDYFLKHGYQGASINAMARSSGISKESIYRYFSSKKQLFEAVIGRELIEYRDTLKRLAPRLKKMELRDSLITISETVLSLITTDRTLALRRLIFEETTRSPDVGQHYHKIGPEQAYATLESVFKAHPSDCGFDAATLSRYFIAMATYRVVLERQCAVTSMPTKQQLNQAAVTVVDDFIKAFLRPR